VSYLESYLERHALQCHLSGVSQRPQFDCARKTRGPLPVCFELNSIDDAISRPSKRAPRQPACGGRYLVAAVTRDSRSTKTQIAMEISGMFNTEFSAVSPQISHALIVSLSFRCGAPVDARATSPRICLRRKFETSRCSYVTLDSSATCNSLSAKYFAISGAVRSGVAAEKS
jgi:hypothetical protein